MSVKFAIRFLVVASAFAHAAHAQNCFRWTQRWQTPGNPSYSLMVFDNARNALVVFGGSYGASTWEWDGVSWALKSAATPPVNSIIGQAVFDTMRGVTLVYIGGTMGQTWSYDGLDWTLVSQSGPTPRSYSGMAFDTARGVAVLHGGRDPNDNELFFNDTWEWDGVAWTLRSTSGPTRKGPALAFDSNRSITVMHGGRAVPENYERNTWEWDGSVWTEVATNSGPFSDDDRMVFDSVRNVCVSFYKPSNGPWYDEWTWDGLAWTSRSVPGPRPVYGPPLAFDPTRGVIFLFAKGFWEWNGTEWTLRSNGYPSTEAIVYDHVNNRILAAEGYGGMTSIWQRQGDQWLVLDSSGPAMGSDPAIAYDEARNVLVLFGGTGSSTDPEPYFGNTWEWDGTVWNLRATDGPAPRGRHRMVYDAARDVTVLFGGWNGVDDFTGDELGDTWEWDGAAWTLRSTSGPSPRFWHGFIYDRQRAVSVVAGGGGVGGLGVGGMNTTWEWDGQSWLERDSIPPAQRGRYRPAFIYDEERRVGVLVGGWDIGPLDGAVYTPGTYEWDGTSWILRTNEGTVSGTGVYDAQNDAVLVYSSNYTWEYISHFPPPETPAAETWGGGAASPAAIKNRYLSFLPPQPSGDTCLLAFRVTAAQLPGPDDCPNVPDFTGRFQTSMWVGGEVLAGAGLYKLSSTPVFRDWSSLPGGVVHVADCNIVPCASYSLEAVSETPCNPGVPAAYSAPIVLATSPIWSDISGNSADRLPDGIVDFNDVSAAVDCFRNVSGSLPRTWCDVGGDSPTQGVNFNIDFGDISLVVDAFKGRSYPFPGPSAPNACP